MRRKIIDFGSLKVYHTKPKMDVILIEDCIIELNGKNIGLEIEYISIPILKAGEPISYEIKFYPFFKRIIRKVKQILWEPKKSKKKEM